MELGNLADLTIIMKVHPVYSYDITVCKPDLRHQHQESHVSAP